MSLPNGICIAIYNVSLATCGLSAGLFFVWFIQGMINWRAPMARAIVAVIVFLISVFAFFYFIPNRLPEGQPQGLYVVVLGAVVGLGWAVRHIIGDNK